MNTGKVFPENPHRIGGTPVVGGTVGSISGVVGFSTGVGFGSTLIDKWRIIIFFL